MLTDDSGEHFLFVLGERGGKEEDVGVFGGIS